MANPGLSEIVTTTLRNRSRQLSDNVMKHNALLNRINENGNRKPFTGRSIQLELEYAENATVSMYSNYDTINTISFTATGCSYSPQRVGARAREGRACKPRRVAPRAARHRRPHDNAVVLVRDHLPPLSHRPRHLRLPAGSSSLILTDSRDLTSWI